MGKASSPPAPDYTSAAQATAAGNLAASQAATQANRVNQYTPYGSSVYSQNAPNTLDQTAYDTAMKNYQTQLANYNNGSNGNPSGGGIYGLFGNSGRAGQSSGVAPIAPNKADFMTNSPNGGWSQTTTLAPAQQAILDSQNQLNLGLNNTANSALTYADKVLSNPGVDTSTLPQVGINPGQSYQDAMMSRLQPQIDRENQQSDAQLANQGIMQGSKAYNDAKQVLNQSHNDLLNNATVQGFNTGLAANQNSFQQQSYNQMQPINVINALRTGSQVQNPTFTGVPQQQTTAGPDILGAQQQQYQTALANTNAQNAQSGNLMNGLFSLGGAYMMSNPNVSDLNVKENINKLYDRADGLGVYEFEYKPEFKAIAGDGKFIGVIAQEVEKLYPHAVSMHPSGYKQVDYARLM